MGREGLNFIQTIYHFGISQDLSEDDRKRIILTNQICTIFLVAASPYIFLFWVFGSIKLSILTFLALLIFVLCLITNKLKYYTLAKCLLNLAIFIPIFYFSSVLGRKSGIFMCFLPATIIPAILFNKREALLKTIFLSLQIMGLGILELGDYSLFEKVYLDESHIKIVYFTILIVVVGIFYLTNTFFFNLFETSEKKLIEKNKDVESQRNQAVAAKEAVEKEESAHKATILELKEKNRQNELLVRSQEVSLKTQEKLLAVLEKQDKEKSELLSQLDQTIVQLTQETQEKEAALIREQEKLRTIQEQASKIEQDRISITQKVRQEKLLKQGAEVQQQILQPMLPESDYFKLFMAYRPSDFISGDYYRITLERGDYLIALVLDAAGHGAPAALMTGIIAKVLDDVFNHPDQYPLTDPSAMMGILNNLFFKEPRIQKMITGTYMVINLKTRQLMVSSAGGEAPLVYSMDCRAMARVNNDGAPLGMYEDETYTATVFQLAERDILLGYTDGFFDHELLDGSPLIPFDEVEYENGSADYAYNYDHIEKWLKARPKSKKDIANYLADKVIEGCHTSKDDMTILAVEIIK